MLSDSLREVSVLVLVFGFLDGVRGAHALGLAVAAFVGGVVAESFRR